MDGRQLSELLSRESLRLLPSLVQRCKFRSETRCEFKRTGTDSSSLGCAYRGGLLFGLLLFGRVERGGTVQLSRWNGRLATSGRSDFRQSWQPIWFNHLWGFDGLPSGVVRHDLRAESTAAKGRGVD